MHAKASLASLPRHKGKPSKDETSARDLLDKCCKASNLLTLGIKQLNDRNITRVCQLVGSPSGGITPLKALPGKGALNSAAYQSLLEDLSSLPQELRAAMYDKDQPTIVTFFNLAKDPPCPRDWNPIAPRPLGVRPRNTRNLNTSRRGKHTMPGFQHTLPSEDP